MEVCPLCGNETRHTPDVIDELVQAMIDESGSIKHIRADTELKEHFVGASLRFPLPPQPDPRCSVLVDNIPVRAKPQTIVAAVQAIAR